MSGILYIRKLKHVYRKSMTNIIITLNEIVKYRTNVSFSFLIW